MRQSSVLLKNWCVGKVWIIEEAVLPGLVESVAHRVIAVHTLFTHEEAEEVRREGLTVSHACATFLW